MSLTLNKIRIMALFGAVIILFLGQFYLYMGLAYSGVLANYNIYVSSGGYPLAGSVTTILAVGNSISGVIGLIAGVMAILGAVIRSSTTKSGVLLVASAAMSMVAFGYLGIVSFILVLTAGVLYLRERPAVANQPS
jgi:hypothetical protein